MADGALSSKTPRSKTPRSLIGRADDLDYITMFVDQAAVRSEVLLIPGTSSMRHLEENMAVANLALDPEARELLASVA